MSYVSDKRSRNPVTVAAVVAVHAAIGYAFISGLAMRVIPYVSTPMIVGSFDDAPPPPPEDLPPPPPRQQPAAQAAPTPLLRVETMVDLPTLPVQEIVPLRPVERIDVAPLPDTRAVDSTQAVSRARSALPGTNRADWVTTDDYPAAALRDGAEGTTAIRVGIGPNGRVTDCTVTAGSGDARLDQATCRTYRARARFTPALDEAGRPVAATRADRVTWRMPR